MSTRWDPLRDSLIAADFHQVVPPDAFAEWEYINDRNTRVRFAPNVLLVEAVDGTAADDFDRAHRGACPSDHAIPDGGAAPERVTLIAGSDEAGKGERERSIAVAAVLMPRAMEGEALARGVRDSKSCTAAEVQELARWIEGAFAHSTQAIHPSLRAEALRAHASNETRLLTAMHAHCLRALHAKAAFSLARVDRFAPNRPVAAALALTHPLTLIDECVRGERHLAVAAASILARAVSLR